MNSSINALGDAQHEDPDKEKAMEHEVIQHLKRHFRGMHGLQQASGHFKHHGHVNLHEPAPPGSPGAPIT
jgi:hypothetical protein